MSETSQNYLSLACEYGHANIATLLLSKGSRLVSNNDGLSPLHLSSREGHAEICQILLENGADINLTDNLKKWSPIFYAAAEGHIECVSTLIRYGCTINLKDDNDWIPWTHALYRGHVDIANLLEVPDESTKFDVSATFQNTIHDASVLPMAPSSFFGKDTDISVESSIDFDEIPALNLPPPIIPFRI